MANAFHIYDTVGLTVGLTDVFNKGVTRVEGIEPIILALVNT
jgi:hypothetical protein